MLVDCISNHENLGYDKALLIGIQRAIDNKFKYVITIDGDGELPVSRIPDIYKKFNSRCDLVVGIRDKKNRFSENIFSIISKWYCGIEDPLCGLKGYKISALINYKIKQTYKSIGTEAMFKLVRMGVGFEQVKINVKKRPDASRFGNFFISNLKIIYCIIKSLNTLR